MYQSCDTCHTTVHRDEGGWWVDGDDVDTAYHAGTVHAHTVNGAER